MRGQHTRKHGRCHSGTHAAQPVLTAPPSQALIETRDSVNDHDDHPPIHPTTTMDDPSAIAGRKAQPSASAVNPESVAGSNLSFSQTIREAQPEVSETPSHLSYLR